MQLGQYLFISFLKPLKPWVSQIYNRNADHDTTVFSETPIQYLVTYSL
jgi:hypothetical protein